MRVKRILIVMILLLLLCLGLFFWYRHSILNRVADMQPMMIVVEGRRYAHGGGTVKQRPQGPPDGTITKVNGKTDYPDADGEANFGVEGMPYWQTGGYVVVESGQYYYVLNPEGNQE